MLEGQFTARVLREHDADPSYGQVEGTRSQIVGYYNRHGAQVALVHQYEQPDGRLGGRSRKPTPKRLRIGDTIYLLAKKQKRKKHRKKKAESN
jgi:hypothetical protein